MFFFGLLWLMVLLTIGTIAQKDLGLYQAQQLYFSSWIVWFWGVIPAPGGQLTMGVIFIGLFAQLIFKTPLKLKTIGISITHLGAFLLILGGIITGYFSFEGSMIIDEGKTSSHFSDYHKLEIAIVDSRPSDHRRVITFDSSYMEKGKILNGHDLPFSIEIINFCGNCTYKKRKINNKDYKGFGKIFKLEHTTLAKEETENRSGISFKLNGNKATSLYSIIEDMPIKQSLVVDGVRYGIEIRHKRYNLPFEIELLDFVKTDYASTAMAKNYKSIVNLIDKKIKQRTIVQMNEPLRYKGYTLYQSSYLQEGEKETTVLSVVHNRGRMFPYISSIIICIGIVIHLLVLAGFLNFLKRDE